MSPDEIADDAYVLEDLGADSLDVVEMLMTLEDEMNITIPDDDVAGLRTVKDIADYLENVAD
jgi:acyl carrier protein